MNVYGIDAGTANTAVVCLENDRWLRRIPTPKVFAEFKQAIGASYEEAWALDPCVWEEFAKRIADWIASNRLYPIGVDAALACPSSDGATQRQWEKLARGFSTPANLNPLPLGGAQQQQYWWRMARLWTTACYYLVKEHGFTLYCDGNVPSGAETRLLVEVYPRLSWLNVVAARRIPIEPNETETAFKDRVLGSCGYSWASTPNEHLRDAAIAAIAARNVVTRSDGYLGESHCAMDEASKCLRGAGIAVPFGDANGRTVAR